MPRGGANFTGEELTCVLSHYDLGIIEKVKSLRVGNTHTPKKIILADKGTFLLKRRPKGKDDIYHVAFSHAIQSHLSKKNFPIAPLLPTREDNNTALHIDNHVYELFVFVKGTRYPTCSDGLRDAGRQLALFHQDLTDFECDWQPLRSTFHDSAQVRSHLNVITADNKANPQSEQLIDMTKKLLKHYDRSAKDVNKLGFSSWQKQIVHGDWHPGNMLFNSKNVACVLDFDSVKIATPATDLANGLLQFSIISGHKNPTNWPANLDIDKFNVFLKGYYKVDTLNNYMLTALPSLMIETMIAEAVLPIAATGTFGHLAGLNFLQMILRKSEWIHHNRSSLKNIITNLR